jgi:hypothetical protein
MARRRRRYRKKRHYPHAYARMTWRGPRVGANWMPGCMIWLVAAVGVVVAAVWAL